MVKQATTAETSFLFDRKVESATAGLPKYYETVLKERTKKKNALTIAEIYRQPGKKDHRKRKSATR